MYLTHLSCFVVFVFAWFCNYVSLDDLLTLTLNPIPNINSILTLLTLLALARKNGPNPNLMEPEWWETIKNNGDHVKEMSTYKEDNPDIFIGEVMFL